MTCPNCQEAAKFVNYRSKTITCLLGDLRLPRPYYYCSACNNGHFPWDQTLHLLDRRTLGATRVITLLGITDSFVQAADRLLYETAGLYYSESTVQRTTESAGRRLTELLAQKECRFLPLKPWEWHKDAMGKTCGYVAFDATGVMMQGVGGTKAEGRMAYIGMVFNPQPLQADDRNTSKPCDNVFYLAGHYQLNELGKQLRQQADSMGLANAKEWIALTDGANGLEELIDLCFPRAHKIVDFWHVSEYVNHFAKAYGGEKGGELATQWCHKLKHEGGKALLAELERLCDMEMTLTAREKYVEVTRYLGNHWERMKYPEYVARGWQIGSGSVESGCKTVINQRLCEGGMRWAEAGSNPVCALRALFRSDEEHWDAFWSTYLAA